MHWLQFVSTGYLLRYKKLTFALLHVRQLCHFPSPLSPSACLGGSDRWSSSAGTNSFRGAYWNDGRKPAGGHERQPNVCRTHWGGTKGHQRGKEEEGHGIASQRAWGSWNAGAHKWILVAWSICTRCTSYWLCKALFQQLSALLNTPAFSNQVNEKGQVVAKSSLLQQMETELVEEAGIKCCICLEGYKNQPQKVPIIVLVILITYLLGCLLGLIVLQLTCLPS